MLDLGMILTGIAAASCLIMGRGVALRSALFMAWATAFVLVSFDSNIDLTVLMMILMDLVIAVTALITVTIDPARNDAKVAGFIAISMMPAHFIVSATQGAIDWQFYAIVCNVAFILQCSASTGALDVLGRSIGSFFSRSFNLRHHSKRGR